MLQTSDEDINALESYYLGRIDDLEERVRLCQLVIVIVTVIVKLIRSDDIETLLSYGITPQYYAPNGAPLSIIQNQANIKKIHVVSRDW